jgi:prolyl 4-hydroxylase
VPTPDPRAVRLREAQARLARGEIDAARAALATLAREGYPPAQGELGRFLAFGLGGEEGIGEGLDWLGRASDAGFPPAWMALAVLSLGERAVPFDQARVEGAVQAAAQAGFPPALRTLALHWGRGGDDALLALGTRCLEHAAWGGDAVSLALLADRLAQGRGCRADPARAAAIAQLLQGSGLPVDAPAAPVDAALAAPASLAPLPPLPKPDFAPSLAAPAAEVRHASPWVATAHGALDAEECRFVTLLGGPMLRPALAGLPDGTRIESQIRTSHAMAFDPLLEDVALRLVQRRMAAFAGLPLAHAEPLTLLRYAPGQEYRPHRDYRPPSAFVPAAQGGPGQRTATVIAYLNAVAGGGVTEFPLLGLRIAPERGGLLAFANLDAEGRPDPRTLHAGLPVESGLKWICTLWICEGPARLV